MRGVGLVGEYPGQQTGDGVGLAGSWAAHHHGERVPARRLDRRDLTIVAFGPPRRRCGPLLDARRQRRRDRALVDPLPLGVQPRAVEHEWPLPRHRCRVVTGDHAYQRARREGLEPASRLGPGQRAHVGRGRGIGVDLAVARSGGAGCDDGRGVGEVDAGMPAQRRPQRQRRTEHHRWRRRRFAGGRSEAHDRVRSVHLEGAEHPDVDPRLERGPRVGHEQLHREITRSSPANSRSRPLTSATGGCHENTPAVASPTMPRKNR